MGLLDFLKGDQTKQIRVDTPRDGLKVAKQLCDSKEYETAIDVLKQTYGLMEEHGDPPTVNDRLRVSRYLRAAGKSDEAWGELNRLSRELAQDRELGFSNLSIIHDAMRIHLEAEKRFDLAVVHAGLSYVYRMRFLFSDRGPGTAFEFENRREVVEQNMTRPLKRAKKLDRLGTVCDTIQSAIENLPRLELRTLNDTIATALRDREKET